MVKLSLVYEGEKHCSLKHEPSGTVIQTDAPKDNQGKGESFSPTDLVGAALGSCILTTMAIVAERDSIDFKQARAEVIKEMSLPPAPRRIAALKLKIFLPASLSDNQKRKLEATAHACPVHKSLHPDVQLPMEFIYEAALV